MAQAQIAERYRALGFRVIEGGKSNKLVILTTAAIAEMFDLEHFHVTRDLGVYRKAMPPNLDALFAEHCHPATYPDSRGRPQQCSALTKVGFLAFATKYDPPLRFLLALAFDALEQDDDMRGAQLIAQINAHVSGLRAQSSGQSEFTLEAPQTTEPSSEAPYRPASVNYDADDDMAEDKNPCYPPLKERNAHHFEDRLGKFVSKRFDDIHGRMGEWWLHDEKRGIRPTDLKLLLPDGERQVLVRLDPTITELRASQACERECGVSLQMIEALMLHLRDR